MEFLTFCDEVQKRILEQGQEFPGQFQFETVQKNNQTLNGIIYRPEHSNVGMTFYAENLYGEYTKGGSLEAIVRDFLEGVKKQSLDMDLVNSALKKRVKTENVVPALIGRKGNQEMLAQMPHVPFENLEIIFKIMVPELEGSLNVTNPMLEEFGMTAEELLETAKNNAAYKDNILITPMEDIVREMMGMELADERELFEMEPSFGQGPQMIVVTNTEKNWGAAAILDKDTMAELAGKIKDDLYILPSSIHECIVVPQKDMEVEFLQEMVRDINEEQVEPGERLSDEVYMFDRHTRELKLAQDARERGKEAFPLPAFSL